MNLILQKPEEREKAEGTETVTIGGHELKLTHQKKIFWPKEGYTKGDLIAYYRDVTPVILPYLTDRPESLNRHPDGIDGESFYQKDVGHQPPPWVKTVAIHSTSKGGTVTYLICQNEATLAYIANLGCIEVNPWNARVTSPKHPDYAVIDLDPEGVPFSRAIEVATVVRGIFEEAGVNSVCKTSGARGLHIYVPLGAKYTHTQVRQFVEVIASIVQQALPHLVSTVRSPKKRQGKVYIDYLQNRYAQTMVAPYSVRPRPGAPVSTPLEWKEVRRGLDPKKFTIRTIGKRLDSHGDLFKTALGKGIDLRAVLSGLAKKYGEKNAEA